MLSEIVKPGRGNNTRSVANKAHEKRKARDKVTNGYNMAKTPKDILKMIEEQEIEWVDVRFTDPKGKWQHLTMVSSVLGEDELTDGLMFDGSSIEGWKAINESDMILKPDLDAVYVDPFSATPMLIIFCVHELMTKSRRSSGSACGTRLQ